MFELNYALIESIIRFLFYIILIAIFLYVARPIITPALSRLSVKRFKLNISNEEKKHSLLYKHIERLLAVTFNTKSTYIVVSFITISLSIFVLAMMFFLQSGQVIQTSLGFSIILGLCPYAYLLVRLHNIRIESSYEGEFLVKELSNQYKIHHLNMLEAIDRTVPRLKEQPYTRKALLRLSIGLKLYRTREELDELILDFSYSIDTQWSELLANNLFLAIEYGDDVNESMEDILEDLKSLKEITEKDKQINYESFAMIKYVIPLAYIFTVYVLFRFFGFNLEKFIDNQFKNPMGFQTFAYTLITIVANYIIYIFIRRPKNDF